MADPAGDEHLRSVERLDDTEGQEGGAESESGCVDPEDGESSMLHEGEPDVAGGEITIGEGVAGVSTETEGEHGEEGEGEEAKVDGTSPLYETAAEDIDGEKAEVRKDVPCRDEEPHDPSPSAESHRSEEQKKKAKVAEVRKLARQRDALKKHVARCSTPRTKPEQKKSPSVPAVSPKETVSPLRSTTVRLEIDRGDVEFTNQPRSVSLRLEDLKGQGRTSLSRSRSPKRAKSHGDIEIIRIEAPEASVPSYSSVVFPVPCMSGGASPPFSELFPSSNLPPEPTSTRPVNCPPTDREAIGSKKTPRERKRSGGRQIPKFVPRGEAGENAWKSGICDCWRDPESYWSGVMEQVV